MTLCYTLYHTDSVFVLSVHYYYCLLYTKLATRDAHQLPGTKIMALSASTAGAGAGMAMTPGMAFGGNAMAAPQAFSSFEPPPSAGPPPGAAGMGTGGGQGAGGAYDLRAWEKEDGPNEDLHACLGIDVGTSTIKVGRPFLGQECLCLLVVVS